MPTRDPLAGTVAKGRQTRNTAIIAACAVVIFAIGVRLDVFPRWKDILQVYPGFPIEDLTFGALVLAIAFVVLSLGAVGRRRTPQHATARALPHGAGAVHGA